MARIVNGESFPDDATDEEISEFRASEGQQPLPPKAGGGFGDLATGLGLGAAGLAGLGGAAYAAKKAPGLVKGVAGRFLAKQIPGVGMAMDVMDAAQQLGGPKAVAPPASLPPTAAPADVTAPAKGRVVLTEVDIKRFPQLKNFNPGETISEKALEKIKLAGMEPPRAQAGKKGGKVPTRKIDVEGKPRARAPQPTENPKYTGGRGASGPELARRAAQLAGEPIPGTMAAVKPGSPDPELWRTRGLSVPRGTSLKGILPGAAAILPFILQGATANQDIENARQEYLRFLLEHDQSPSLRRARTDVPQGI